MCRFGRNLENRLRDVRTDRRDRCIGSSSQSWEPAGADVHGTRMPGGAAVHSIKSGHSVAAHEMILQATIALMHRSEFCLYSITSSASARIFGGTSRPSAAPPRSTMNWRRCMIPPKRRRRTVSAQTRTLIGAETGIEITAELPTLTALPAFPEPGPLPRR